MNNSLSELLTVKHTLAWQQQLQSSATPVNLKRYGHLANVERYSIKRISRWRSRSRSNLLPWQPPERWLMSIRSRCALERVTPRAHCSIGGLESRNQVWCWLSWVIPLTIFVLALWVLLLHNSPVMIQCELDDLNYVPKFRYLIGLDLS